MQTPNRRQIEFNTDSALILVTFKILISTIHRLTGATVSFNETKRDSNQDFFNFTQMVYWGVVAMQPHLRERDTSKEGAL